MPGPRNSGRSNVLMADAPRPGGPWSGIARRHKSHRDAPERIPVRESKEGSQRRITIVAYLAELEKTCAPEGGKREKPSMNEYVGQRGRTRDRRNLFSCKMLRPRETGAGQTTARCGAWVRARYGDPGSRSARVACSATSREGTIYPAFGTGELERGWRRAAFEAWRFGWASA
jgi:hypothetical protein